MCFSSLIEAGLVSFISNVLFVIRSEISYMSSGKVQAGSIMCVPLLINICSETIEGEFLYIAP